MFVSKSFRILKCWLIELIAIIEFEESHLVHLDWIKTEARFLITSFIFLKINSTEILQSTSNPCKTHMQDTMQKSDFSMLKFGFKFELNVVTESITEGCWHLTVEISELPILKISNAIDFHSLLRLFVMITSGMVQLMHFAISNVWPGNAIYP